MNKYPLKKQLIFKLLKKIKKFNLGKDLVSLELSLGRFLSKDLISKINLPPFNNSAVDGFALHKSDILKKNLNLSCSFRLAAGDNYRYKLKKGEAVRIFTGARMPLNSKTVIMQENVLLKNKKIKIKKIPLFGENCRLLGEDISIGKKILSKGEKINIKNINLVAAIGKQSILVEKKIKVGFFTSGNELMKPTENLKGSEINNSNYYSLSALLKKTYIDSKYLGILKDDKNIIAKKFLKNIDKYNIIITTGGASVGDEDHLINVIKELGNLYFWKTAIKPGRPLAIGKIKNTIVICLPGNPVSVHLLYGMIIKPFIEYLCTGKFIVPEGIKVKTNFIMKKKNKRLEWLRVNLKTSKNDLLVNKYNKQGSGMISSMVFADGIIEIPENIKMITKKDIFNFYSFDSLFN